MCCQYFSIMLHLKVLVLCEKIYHRFHWKLYLLMKIKVFDWQLKLVAINNFVFKVKTFSFGIFIWHYLQNVSEMSVFSRGWCRNVFEMKPGIYDCHWIIDEHIVLIYNAKDKFIGNFTWLWVVIHFPVKRPVSVRISHRRCSIKKLFLNILQISQKNTCVVVSF